MNSSVSDAQRFPWRDTICIVLMMLCILSGLGYLALTHRGLVSAVSSPLAVLIDSLLAGCELVLPKVVALGGILFFVGGIAFSGLFRPVRVRKDKP